MNFRGGARLAPVAALALLALLAGCAALSTGPAPAAEPDLPGTWTATPTAATATSLADWWQRFNDPDLTQLVADALGANTSVLGAEAALRQARALRDVSAAGLQPTLGSSSSVQRWPLLTPTPAPAAPAWAVCRCRWRPRPR